MGAEDYFDYMYEVHMALYTEVGWHGEWTREFIRRDRADEDLGCLDYVHCPVG